MHLCACVPTILMQRFLFLFVSFKVHTILHSDHTICLNECLLYLAIHFFSKPLLSTNHMSRTCQFLWEHQRNTTHSPNLGTLQ